jgi:hypothetical protein
VHGGRGEGAFSAAMKICFNKNVNCTDIIIKSTLKMTFLWKTSETTNIAEIFREALLIFNKLQYFA